MDSGWPFISGLFIGLGMILPIGPQNVFVLTQSIAGGIRRGMVAALTAGVCDTMLIIAGAAGLSSALVGLPWLRQVLLLGGTVFLFYLGVTSFYQAEQKKQSLGGHGVVEAYEAGLSSWRLVGKGIGVSWGNPHAILDTVGVLGAAIAAYPAEVRFSFAVGTITASWLFFSFLMLIGSFLRKKISPQTEVWINRFSGAIMLVFAVILGLEAIK